MTTIEVYENKVIIDGRKYYPRKRKISKDKYIGLAEMYLSFIKKLSKEDQEDFKTLLRNADLLNL